MGTFENIKKDSGYVIAGFVCLLGVFATASIKAEMIPAKFVVEKANQEFQVNTSSTLTDTNTEEQENKWEDERAVSYESNQPCR